MGFILNTYTNIGTAKMDPPPPKRPMTIPVKKAPKYPRKALRTQTQGSVIVEFTVDELGFTRDHKVFKSSGSVFDRSAIAAVQEFRYAPQYKNGVAVPTSGVMNQILYEIR